MLFEDTGFIQHISDTAGHARGEIATGLADDDHTPAGHIFAGVVPHAFNNRAHTTIADTETLSRHPTNIGFTVGGSIERHITNDNVFLRGERRSFRRIEDHFATGKPLAKIIIGIPSQCEAHAGRQKSPETLPRRSVEMEMNRVFGQAFRPEASGYFAAK